jgi:drug/metabolite transporter (DMT)-like permease
VRLLSHRQAVATIVAAALLWSIAGVVTRHLESARGFELTFWRSLFNAVALLLLLAWLRGARALAQSLRGGGRAMCLSAACWCVMYTAFMLALTLTTVANVLVTMALAPPFTALAARFALKHRLAARTWGAIIAAGAGIAWMYGHDVAGSDSRHLIGTAVALCVPLAAASNWTLLQHQARRRDHAATQDDMLVAVLLGACLSAALTMPLAWPLAASKHDVGFLALLGLVQLAIPCLMAVTAARTLSAPEASLLSLLEIVFGVAWAWIGAGEAPSAAALAGGMLVLAALAANEFLAMRSSRAPA